MDNCICSLVIHNSTLLSNYIFSFQGDFMAAERLFKDVLSRLFQSGQVESPEDNKVVAISLKLADIHAGWHGKEKEAFEGYKFCVGILNKKVKTGRVRKSALGRIAMSLKQTFF